MGRSVQKIRAEDATWFVPSIGGNRLDPSPFRVLIAPLSGEDLLKAQSAAFDGKAGGIHARAQDLVERLVSTYVLKVERYTVTDDTGASAEIRTGAELVDAIKHGPAGELDIFDEIVEALKDRSKLEAGAEKKSSTPSAFSAPTATKPTHGLVPTARVRESTPTPTPQSS